MPPLSLTQSKYALATFPIVVKSTPGISMSRPSILIGAPVAFLPVPLPQTDFVADAVPEPTAGAVGAPTAQAARLSAPTLLAAIARPSLIFVDPIRSLLASRFDGLNHWASDAAAAAPPDHGLVKRALLESVPCEGRGSRLPSRLWVSRCGASTSRILDHCLDEWNTRP